MNYCGPEDLAPSREELRSLRATWLLHALTSAQLKRMGIENGETGDINSRAKGMVWNELTGSMGISQRLSPLTEVSPDCLLSLLMVPRPRPPLLPPLSSSPRSQVLPSFSVTLCVPFLSGDKAEQTVLDLGPSWFPVGESVWYLPSHTLQTPQGQ